MIASLRGILLEKTGDGAVIEVAGVGYAVALSTSVRDALPSVGGDVFFHIIESVAMYGGGVSLYGFPTAEDKKIYLALKDNVPGTGAKKALELLDKASKSPAAFRQSIADKDVKRLVSLFGFTSKTAEKLVAGLKDKLDELPSSAIAVDGKSDTTSFEEAVQGLAALGYRESDAREAARLSVDTVGRSASSQAVIKDALRRLSGR
jgi:Holliday junction DNA helicase RuvA